MPEGHTIHRAARDHRAAFRGQRLSITSPQGRFEYGAGLIDGQTCMDVEAFGKHLIYRFDNALNLHIHLGLFGRLRRKKLPAAEPKGAVRVRLIGDSHVVDINGPNTCDVLTPDDLARLTARIGPDVLRADADPALAFARIAESRTSIGVLLMDQSVMAGIGNIYRTEILWRARLHPEIPGRAVSREIFDQIWADSVRLLELGVRRNAIITADDAMAAPASRTRYRERVNIFGHPQCPACGDAIRRFAMAGRTAYACETCQPPGSLDEK